MLPLLHNVHVVPQALKAGLRLGELVVLDGVLHGPGELGIDTLGRDVDAAADVPRVEEVAVEGRGGGGVREVDQVVKVHHGIGDGARMLRLSGCLGLRGGGGGSQRVDSDRRSPVGRPLGEGARKREG